ncbi:hypothetical protein DFJ77DRAFT_352080 [Powellomyces hirtus]|nr:hypothetical protein DFJ77DRAFT_352080 [Powellomyces hirtus]
MASSHHSYSSYPAFQLRYPLGKSFATAGLKQHSPTRPRTAPSSDKHHSYAHHPPRPESSAAKRNTAPQQRTRTGDEYVKNLQQQIYLLELETRYLRAGRSDDGTPFPLASGPRSGTPPTSDRAAPAAPLGEVIQDLRGKYVELQEGYRQEVETLKSDLQALQTTHASSTQQLSTLKSQVASLTSQLAKSESTASRDRESLQMELSAAKQRLDAAGAEVERWEGLYEDGVAACEELRKDAVKMEAVLSSEKNKVGGTPEWK